MRQHSALKIGSLNVKGSAKHPRAIQNSGGIIMYISNSIMGGVTKVDARAHSGFDAIWIKLDNCIMRDLEGQLKCCSRNGSSTNDLFLFHMELYNQINHFKVDDEFHWYSDHRSISFSLQISLLLHNSKHSKTWKQAYRNKMLWNPEAIEKYN